MLLFAFVPVRIYLRFFGMLTFTCIIRVKIQCLWHCTQRGECSGLGKKMFGLVCGRYGGARRNRCPQACTSKVSTDFTRRNESAASTIRVSRAAIRVWEVAYQKACVRVRTYNALVPRPDHLQTSQRRRQPEQVDECLYRPAHDAAPCEGGCEGWHEGRRGGRRGQVRGQARGQARGQEGGWCMGWRQGGWARRGAREVDGDGDCRGAVSPDTRAIPGPWGTEACARAAETRRRRRRRASSAATLN